MTNPTTNEQIALERGWRGRRRSMMHDKPVPCRHGIHKWGEWKLFWNRVTDLQSKSRWCDRCFEKQERKQIKVWVDV